MERPRTFYIGVPAYDLRLHLIENIPGMLHRSIHVAGPCPGVLVVLKSNKILSSVSLYTSANILRLESVTQDDFMKSVHSFEERCWFQHQNPSVDAFVQ
jgi:hypothetical protein